MFHRFLVTLLLITFGTAPLLAQPKPTPPSKPGAPIEKRRDAAKRPKRDGLYSAKGDAIFLIKNVDITHFPEMSVIFSAVNNRNQFIRTLKLEDVIVLENGIPRPILSLELVSARNRVPIDIVFAIDVTASMRNVINTVKQNVNDFAEQLRQHGFDARLGMVLFSDYVEWVSPELTDNVTEFERWVGNVQTVGGGDIPENSLEALNAVATMNLRPIAMRMVCLITDAPPHKKGDFGDGTTKLQPTGVGDFLYEREVRVLTVTPPELNVYHDIALLTEGASFDLDSSFSSVLAGLIEDITSLYSLRYLSQSTLAPDSVRIDILRAEDKSPLASRKLLAMEPGRRFVFEDLQFAANQTALASEFVPELERVVRLMHVRPNMKIRIEGHADSTGGSEENQKLSELRAASVASYLMQSGIATTRDETVGYGETRPLGPNDTEEQRRRNRRIEFVILSK
ncbi:MAG TPA: OmpA family protein [Candidatus Kapabacteria bacterium]|nr:OmpA family protein [Candidatus Kapabacteria bacterium]